MPNCGAVRSRQSRSAVRDDRIVRRAVSVADCSFPFDSIRLAKQAVRATEADLHAGLLEEQFCLGPGARVRRAPGASSEILESGLRRERSNSICPKPSTCSGRAEPTNGQAARRVLAVVAKAHYQGGRRKPRPSARVLRWAGSSMAQPSWVFAPDDFVLYETVREGEVIRMGQPLMRLP
jgi:hypothetical protein